MNTAWIVFVLLLSLFPIYTEGTGQCHCASASSCEQYPDGTCSSCEQFWSGSNCQIYNIARGDLQLVRVSQGTSDPNIVVDGVKTESPQKCTDVTDEFGTTASWTIKFNKTHNIYRMRIYHYSGYAESLRKFEIHVNVELCKRISRSSNPSPVIDVTCGQPLTGDLVSISIPTSNFEYYTLALCEVEIYECGDYWYGEQCDKRCSCVDTNEVCDKVDGGCVSGTTETTASTTPSPTTSQSTKPTTVSDGLSSSSQAVSEATSPAGETDSTISLGQIAGVVVGALLGFAAIVAVVIIIIYKVRHPRRPKVQDTSPNPVTMKTDTGPPLPPTRGLPGKPFTGNGKSNEDKNSSPYNRPGPQTEEHEYAYIVTYDDAICEKAEKDGHYVELSEGSMSNDYYLEPVHM